MSPSDSLDDLLDTLVSEFSDALAGGQTPSRQEYLGRVPAHARPGLERVLKMIEAGMARPPATSEPLRRGIELDNFRLEREIGRGGMAIVWLAQDLQLKRPVALKILRPGLALEPRHVDRFRREALAIAKLKHPHIVSIHGVGETRGYHWLAMEYVEGPSFATVLEALPIDRPRTAEDLARAAQIPSLAAGGRTFDQAVAQLLAPIAEALSTAHDNGLVHRDVKPSNILIHRDGRAVIADFGLAKGDDDPALSLTGEGLGTPYYMSPEQAYLTGKTVDHRTDVYSLGVTLYEALAGHRPFRGESFLEVIESIRSTIPPSLSARQCSRDSIAVVRRAMAREPEQRYANAQALHDDLCAMVDGRPTDARSAEGGLLRRAWSRFKRAGSGQTVEYKSATTFLGLPLVHWYSGPRAAGTRPRVAKGWLASGDIALGGLTFGPIAAGLTGCGGISAGLLFGWGGITVGGLALGGVSAGVLSCGGLSLGRLAIGGVSYGFAAIGGVATGTYVAGGKTFGEHVMTGQHVDPAAEAFFEELFSSFSGFWSTLF